MEIGAILMAQNSQSYRLAAASDARAYIGSSQFMRDEIGCGQLAVDLGFSSIWSVEHHFTPHGELPAPLQQLAYFAGRAPRASLGTCVVVLPWNDPIRVAEQIAVLDNLMEPETRFTLGVGRGSAQPEFDGFEISLGESSDRFMENWEIIKLLLTETNVSYSGKWRSITNVTTLPRPRSQDIIERAHYSWGSKTSLRFAAEAGFSPLFVAKGSPEENGADIKEFNQIRTDLGWEPTQPIICLNVFADPDPHRAREEGRRYLREFYANTLDHYQRFDAQHFHQAGNYQETAQQAELLARRDRDEVLDELAGLQVTGTPDEVLQQLEVWKQAMGPSQILLAMKFGGMPADVATKNIHTVSGLLPELTKW